MYTARMGQTPQPPANNATVLLNAAANGDKAAADQLLPLVYEQLRKAAQLDLANERPGLTLSATALVHEAYIKLVGPREVPWAGRVRFYSAAAEAMRRILIDHARARMAQRRGGPGEDHTGQAVRRLPMAELREVADLARAADPEGIVSLDAAVSRLETEDLQAASVVRLRFYAGLSIEQTAEVLGISSATVKRDWQFARAWLFRRLQ